MTVAGLVAALVVACGSSAHAPASGSSVVADPVLGKRVDAVIDKAIEEEQMVGVVVMIARDGKVVYARAAGFADREGKVAAREDTLFRIASMTKPIVSVAALALIGASVRLSPARIFDAASFASGGAGLAATARDYLRFAETLRTGGAPILEPETARALSENQIGERDVMMLGPGGKFGFGVGVMTNPAGAKSPRGRGTFGWAGVYGTAFWIDPQARMSVVVFTNVAGESPFEQEIEKAVYGAGAQASR